MKFCAIVKVGQIDPDQTRLLEVLGPADVDDVGVGRVDRQRQVVVAIGGELVVGGVVAVAVVGIGGQGGLDRPGTREVVELDQGPVLASVLGDVEASKGSLLRLDRGVEPVLIEQVFGGVAGQGGLGQNDRAIVRRVGRDASILDGNRLGGKSRTGEQRVLAGLPDHQAEGLTLIGTDEDTNALERRIDDVEVARRGALAIRVKGDIRRRRVVERRDQTRCRVEIVVREECPGVPRINALVETAGRPAERGVDDDIAVGLGRGVDHDLVRRITDEDMVAERRVLRQLVAVGVHVDRAIEQRPGLTTVGRSEDAHASTGVPTVVGVIRPLSGVTGGRVSVARPGKED